jgi:hypothetical protein
MHGSAGTSHNAAKAMSGKTRCNIVMAIVTSRNAQMRGRAATLCDLRRRGPGRGVGKIVAVAALLALVALTICPGGKRKIARVGIAPSGGESRAETSGVMPTP